MLNFNYYYYYYVNDGNIRDKMKCVKTNGGSTNRLYYY